METYTNYKGYGITYYSISGTTIVEFRGFRMATYKSMGESKGLELAKEYIDEL